MFERFTDRARRVLVLAQEEARLLNHSFMGTEHILLGLIGEEKGVAAVALERCGISLEAVVENLPRQTNPWVGDTFEWRLKARFAQPVNPARLVAWLAAPCIRSPLPFEPVFALPSKRYAVRRDLTLFVAAGLNARG